MSREIVLIGGKFHRQRVRIDGRQHVIKMPIIPEIRAMTEAELMNPTPIKYVEYCAVHSILGEYDIIPSHVYIEKDTSPVEFIRNLVLDYVR